MYRRFLGAGLVVALFLSLQAPGLGADKKDKKAEKDVPPPVDADKLPVGEFTGKLKVTPGSDNTFVVSVEYSHLELKNPNALPKNTKNPQLQALIRDQQRMAQLQTQIATARTQQQAVHLMQQLQNLMSQAQIHQLQALTTQANQPSPYVMKKESKDITFHSAEDLKVRFLNPPSAFDEKGNVKKYTTEELKELKGKDSKLPGYEGSVEKLTVGMPVKFSTVIRKPAPKKEAEKPKEAAAPADKDAAAKDKEPAEKPPAEPKTVVNVIVVQGDETSGTSTDDKSKKPKK